MKTDRILSTVSRVAAALPIALLIGGLWYARANDFTWEDLWLAALVASAAVAGITWRRVRIRARRRWQAALDTWAEREIRRERRRIALGRVGTLGIQA
jgi:hypothetical protein